MTPAQIAKDRARGVKCRTCAAPVGQSCKDGGLDVAPHADRLTGAKHAAYWGVYHSPESRAEHDAERAAIPGYAPASASRITLVSCSSKKLDVRAMAHTLYTSPLFRMSRSYAEDFEDAPWFIISAKHGLVHPMKWLEPYDVEMSKLSKRERASWGARVCASISALPLWKPGTRSVVVLAGEDYVRELRALRAPHEVSEPMRGMMIGERLAWLKARVPQ